MAQKGTNRKNSKNTGKKVSSGPALSKAKGAPKRREILTRAQEDFCIYLIAEGLSQREAYRKAYPNCKAKDSVVDVKASQLAKMDKVRIRIEVLMDDARRRRYRNAVARMPQVEEELINIGLGKKTYPAYDADGNEVQRYPTVSQRARALSELNKIYNTVMDKNEIGGEEDKVVINLAVLDE